MSQLTYIGTYYFISYCLLLSHTFLEIRGNLYPFFVLYRKEAILVIIERDCTSEINGRCEGGSNKKKVEQKD